MAYETRINSLSKMMSELSTLDPDAGIRSMGRFSSRKCFVFITKSVNTYTVALYSVRISKKENLPDKRLLVEQFQSSQELEAFLDRVVTKPVKAFAY